MMDNIDYSYEEERIKSFSTWHIQFPVDPARLAKAGFYYTGYQDEVICFSCQGRVKNWNYGDVVQRRHSELFPLCDFVNNKSKNVPIMQSKINNHVNIGDGSSSGATTNAVSLETMKTFQGRLKSFNCNWPHSDIVASNLASAGFFYLGKDDKVQCAFCKGVIRNWKVDDDPLDEHIRHFPWCSYLSIKQNSISKSVWFQSVGPDVCDNMKVQEKFSSKLVQQSEEHINLIKLGVHMHNGPIHPEQATLDARIQSFDTWPDYSPVLKEDLSKAGFFYMGISDHTKCFHCNGGLCNWEIKDDPWVEHARWFQNCDFLRKSKGQSFIESCLREQEHASGISSTTEIMSKVDKAMNSDVVTGVLESRVFPRYIIRAAILRHLKDTGTTFSSVDDLCLAVSYLKEEMEKDLPKMSNLKAADLNICDIDLRKCSMEEKEESGHKLKYSLIAASSSGEKSGIPALNIKATSQNIFSKDHYLCKICMDKEVAVVFLPCGHLLACTECSPSLKLCPMCRKKIQATVRAYLP